MGKKLDKFLGRSSKQTSKLKALLGLCVARLEHLRSQHQVRYLQARGDVTEILMLGHRDRALIRAEQVIKEKNILDVFAMIESYCHLLTERVAILEYQNECPDELQEAISSLIFVASRSGELPELQDIRRKFTEKFGREFASGAVELRSDCKVNQKLIQKLSTRHPSLESKSTVVKEIAVERGIELDLNGLPFQIKEVDPEMNQRKIARSLPVDMEASPGQEQVKLFSEPMKVTQKHEHEESEKEAYVFGEDYDDQNFPGSDWRENSPPSSITEKKKIEIDSNTEKIHNYHNEPHLPPRSNRKLNSLKSEEQYAWPFKKSSSSISSDSNESPFEIKNAVSYEVLTTKSSATDIFLDENESETEKPYALGSETEKLYGIGGMSLPTRRLMTFAGINRNSFQLYSQFNAAPDEEIDDMRDISHLPHQKRNARSLVNTSNYPLNRERHMIGPQSRHYGSPVKDYSEDRSQSHISYLDSSYSPVQQSKILKSPRSVRTRRRFQPEKEVGY